MAFENIKKLLGDSRRSLNLNLKDLRLIFKDLINFESEQTEQTGTYKKYVALLTQSGSNPGDHPTAIELENTIGNIVWTRNNPGDYTGTLNEAFPDQNKIAFIMGAPPNPTQGVEQALGWNDANSVYLGNGADDTLFFQTIEIRVYP